MTGECIETTKKTTDRTSLGIWHLLNSYE
jgi:hypothetical protein